MLELARQHLPSGGSSISYVLDDAQLLAALADASFDGVTCQLALMDIADLDAAISSIHRVLARGAGSPS